MEATSNFEALAKKTSTLRKKPNLVHFESPSAFLCSQSVPEVEVEVEDRLNRSFSLALYKQRVGMSG